MNVYVCRVKRISVCNIKTIKHVNINVLTAVIKCIYFFSTWIVNIILRAFNAVIFPADIIFPPIKGPTVIQAVLVKPLK